MSAPARKPIHIPDHWTPEQALAVFEWLSELTEHVWAHYDHVIIDAYRNDTAPDLPDNANPDAQDFDDDIPF